MASELMMERETQVAFGPVPHSLAGDELGDTSWQMKDEQFLLRGEGDHYFLYRKGHGITVERGATADLSEEALWLNGSVYAAIASINGLLPIHASAVAHGGEVFAFTGPAGAGKSTLAAGLAQHGLPMFCDDTLILDLSDPDRIVCLPGHKRLKLTANALVLTGAEREEQVSSTVSKSYARPIAGTVDVALPLGELIFLEEASDIEFDRITGGERLARLQDDHYTADLFASARRFDRAAHFAHLSRLARQIRMTAFHRPFDPERFGEGLSAAARHIKDAACAH